MKITEVYLHFTRPYHAALTPVCLEAITPPRQFHLPDSVWFPYLRIHSRNDYDMTFFSNLYVICKIRLKWNRLGQEHTGGAPEMEHVMGYRLFVQKMAYFIHPSISCFVLPHGKDYFCVYHLV